MKKRIFFAVLFLLMLIFSGCGYLEEPVDRMSFGPEPQTAELPENYYAIEAGQSSAAEVLEVIHRPDYELMAQSESSIVSWGNGKKGYRMWLTMASFAEEDVTVTRKYFLAVDEKSYHLFAEDQKLFFAVKAIISPELLERNFTSRDQRKITVLKRVFDNFKEDIRPLVSNGETLRSADLTVRQAVNGIITKLEQSPSLASRLVEKDGLKFDHITMGPGRVRMVILGDTAELMIKIGYRPLGFEFNLDFDEMSDLKGDEQ
jgi:hypothetical protein